MIYYVLPITIITFIIITWIIIGALRQYDRDIRGWKPPVIEVDDEMDTAIDKYFKK